jgi:hypothetical protein
MLSPITKNLKRRGTEVAEVKEIVEIAEVAKGFILLLVVSIADGNVTKFCFRDHFQYFPPIPPFLCVSKVLLVANC